MKWVFLLCVGAGFSLRSEVVLQDMSPAGTDVSDVGPCTGTSLVPPTILRPAKDVVLDMGKSLLQFTNRLTRKAQNKKLRSILKNEIVKEGFLLSKSRNFGMYNKRYFVLTNTELYRFTRVSGEEFEYKPEYHDQSGYYQCTKMKLAKTLSDIQKKELGTEEWERGVEKITWERRFAFEVTFTEYVGRGFSLRPNSDREPLVMQASSETEREQWMEAINGVILECKEREQRLYESQAEYQVVSTLPLRDVGPARSTNNSNPGDDTRLRNNGLDNAGTEEVKDEEVKEKNTSDEDFRKHRYERGISITTGDVRASPKKNEDSAAALTDFPTEALTDFPEIPKNDIINGSSREELVNFPEVPNCGDDFPEVPGGDHHDGVPDFPEVPNNDAYPDVPNDTPKLALTKDDGVLTPSSEKRNIRGKGVTDIKVDQKKPALTSKKHFDTSTGFDEADIYSSDNESYTDDD